MTEYRVLQKLTEIRRPGQKGDEFRKIVFFQTTRADPKRVGGHL